MSRSRRLSRAARTTLVRLLDGRGVVADAVRPRIARYLWQFRREVNVGRASDFASGYASASRVITAELTDRGRKLALSLKPGTPEYARTRRPPRVRPCPTCGAECRKGIAHTCRFVMVHFGPDGTTREITTGQRVTVTPGVTFTGIEIRADDPALETLRARLEQLPAYTYGRNKYAGVKLPTPIDPALLAARLEQLPAYTYGRSKYAGVKLPTPIDPALLAAHDHAVDAVRAFMSTLGLPASVMRPKASEEPAIDYARAEVLACAAAVAVADGRCTCEWPPEEFADRGHRSTCPWFLAESARNARNRQLTARADAARGAWFRTIADRRLEVESTMYSTTKGRRGWGVLVPRIATARFIYVLTWDTSGRNLAAYAVAHRANLLDLHLRTPLDAKL